MSAVLQKDESYMKKEIIPVFFAVDDNYVDYLQITLASIIDNAKNEKYSYDFYILHNGLGQESRKKLSALSHRRFRIYRRRTNDSIHPLQTDRWKDGDIPRQRRMETIHWINNSFDRANTSNP